MKFIVEYLGKNPDLTINQLFDMLKNTKSDINEHMEILRSYAEKCEHVTEMGTRHCISTIAFLAADPSTLICYDLKKTSTVNHVTAMVKDTKFVFHEKNTLEVQIDATELLFIDTLHTYEQLKKELELHGNKAKKYLIFHDTEVFGNRDGHGYNGPGLMPAINGFLQKNSHWIVKEKFSHNNGLVILERR